MASYRTYMKVLTDAVNDLVANGFDSMARVEHWMNELSKAAAATLMPEHRLQQLLSDSMATIYQKLVDRGDIARMHPGISRFTLDKVKPRLRAELDRRIMASAQLIKLNRRAAIEKTLQRFSGWATSIPAGGTDATNRTKVKGDIKKSLSSLPFVERRVIIDQGHKLRASLGDILAKDGGAIACVWHSHWRQAGYDYREDHKERDGNVYLLKSSWALDKAYVKPGPAGWYDDVTAVGEEVYCRCFATYLYNLRDLPKDMVTLKGAQALELARKALEAA